MLSNYDNISLTGNQSVSQTHFYRIWFWSNSVFSHRQTMNNCSIFVFVKMFVRNGYEEKTSIVWYSRV